MAEKKNAGSSSNSKMKPEPILYALKSKGVPGSKTLEMPTIYVEMPTIYVGEDEVGV